MVSSWYLNYDAYFIRGHGMVMTDDISQINDPLYFAWSWIYLMQIAIKQLFVLIWDILLIIKSKIGQQWNKKHTQFGSRK